MPWWIVMLKDFTSIVEKCYFKGVYLVLNDIDGVGTQQSNFTINDRIQFLPIECPSRITISAILFFYSAAWYHLFPRINEQIIQEKPGHVGPGDFFHSYNVQFLCLRTHWRRFSQSISWHSYFECPRASQFHTQQVLMYCVLCCTPAFKLITASCNLCHSILYVGSYLVKKFQFASSDDKIWSLNTLSVDILFLPPWTFGARYSPQLSVIIPWTVLFRKCSVLVFWS